MSLPVSQFDFRLSLTRYLQVAGGFSLIVLDQFTKIIWQFDLCLNPAKSITSFFNLVCVWNHGVSFGLGNAGTTTPEFQRNLLIGLTGLLTLLVGYWWVRSKNKLEQWGCILVMSGAIGNIMDRFHYNAVFDFLDFHVFGYHWPAFNLADSCICVGVLTLLTANLLTKPKVS